MMNKSHQHGFVLITGLIFLVVITLLALSSMSSTSLQEKMATNLREQARAHEAADAALREGESRLSRFTNYPLAGRAYQFDPTPAQDNGDEINWRLWLENGPLAGSLVSEFLAADTWTDDPDDPNDAAASDYSLPFDNGLNQPPQLYVEEMDNFQPNDLNPDTSARARGQFMYRVTGRAQGGTPAAVAVTQSFYLKRY